MLRLVTPWRTMSATITTALAAAQMYQPFDSRAKSFSYVIYKPPECGTMRDPALGAARRIGGGDPPHAASNAEAAQ